MYFYTVDDAASLDDPAVAEPQRPADDIEEASMESFPASDPPATRHGANVPTDKASQPVAREHLPRTDDAAESAPEADSLPGIHKPNT
jgi:hypothetical protein